MIIMNHDSSIIYLLAFDYVSNVMFRFLHVFLLKLIVIAAAATAVRPLVKRGP